MKEKGNSKKAYVPVAHIDTVVRINLKAKLDS